MENGQRIIKELKVNQEYKSIGVYKFNNENRYDGEIVNDKKNGKGITKK